MHSSFWRGKRVLLTGHSGFKGSWLALWLHRLDSEVAGFALPPQTDPSLFELAALGNVVRSRFGDIRDLEELARFVSDVRPQIVIHLAAQALVHQGYRDPLETYATNVLGTAHVLEAARRSSDVRVVLSVTSDKCYQNREWPWGYRETDALGGNDPYSSSKACAELVTAAYRRSFLGRAEGERGPIAVASARSGNVIGGGDWSADRLIPDLVRGITAGRPVAIRRPGATRPWQHVLDPLHGYLALAERLWDGDPAWSDAWNFGPDEGDVRSVGWIAERLAASWGEGARWERDPRSHPPEATLLKLDSSKSRQVLGWHPVLPLQEALEWTVSWYRRQHDGADARRLTENQIQAYQERVEGS